MKQFSLLQGLYLAFYSKAFYRDVALRWGGYALLYLLFLLSVSWILCFNTYRMKVNHFYDRLTTDVISQVPILSLKDGKLSTPEHRPYLILADTPPERIAVIDVTKTYQTPDEAKTGLLVTETKIITKSNDVIKTYDIPSGYNGNINFKAANDVIRDNIVYFLIPVLLILILFSFIYRLIQALVYAILGKIIALSMKVSLPYVQITLIAMVALTPTIVLSTILDFFDITFDHQYSIYFLLAIGYLMYGIYANKTNNNKTSN